MYIEHSESLWKAMHTQQDTNGQKSWCFPKFHMLQHSFLSFQAKGVPANTSTKPGKCKHTWICQVFQSGNFKNTARRVQICNYFITIITNCVLLSRLPHLMSISIYLT